MKMRLVFTDSFGSFEMIVLEWRLASLSPSSGHNTTLLTFQFKKIY